MLHSIEVLARPQSPFYTRVQKGMHTLVLRGELQPLEGGEFSVEFRFSHLVDDGRTVATVRGREPVLGVTSCRTRLQVALDTPLTPGGVETSASDFGVARRSKETLKLTLSKYVERDELPATIREDDLE